jgi:non-homologous end joining protein Ku
MHRGRREAKMAGRDSGGYGADVSKAIIAGLLDRKRGRVHAEVVPNVRAESLAPIIRKNVKKGYETSKGKWVVIEPDELKKLAPQSTKAIEIEDIEARVAALEAAAPTGDSRQ